jgi:phage tail sheath gpL-like
MAVDATAVARVVGINAEFIDLRQGAVQYLPQHIGIIGQGATASAGYLLEPYRITNAAQAAARYGFGSPIHLAALQLFPPTGDGVGSIPVTVYPLVDDYDAGLPAVGSITPSGAAGVQGTYRARISGILSAPFTLAVGDNVATICDKLVAAINAVLEMPVIAADGTTDVDLTAKWDGASGNGIVVEILTSAGHTPTDDVTFTVTPMASGAADPDIAPALAMLGSTWVTLIVNALGPTNTDALNALSAVGEGRWGQLVRKPFVAFTGSNEVSVGTATTITNARTLDRVNAQLVAPGSPNLPVQIAAAQVREIAKVANNNPPTDYGSRLVQGLVPGADGAQWDYVQRDQAVKAGSSTTEIKNGLVNISDVVTFYHKLGESPPAYRHLVDIIKLMTVIYNLSLEFSNPSWDGAPLIPDDQPTVNPNARKPSAAKAAVNRILDSLGLEAIISDPATAKKSTLATINSQNPKRLDVRTTIQLSGNTNIISVDVYFGFDFGTLALVA